MRPHTLLVKLAGTPAGDGSTIHGKVGAELGGIPYLATLDGTLEGGRRISAQTSVFAWYQSGSSRRSDSVQLELSR